MEKKDIVPGLKFLQAIDDKILEIEMVSKELVYFNGSKSKIHISTLLSLVNNSKDLIPMITEITIDDIKPGLKFYVREDPKQFEISKVENGVISIKNAPREFLIGEALTFFKEGNWHIEKEYVRPARKVVEQKMYTHSEAIELQRKAYEAGQRNGKIAGSEFKLSSSLISFDSWLKTQK